MTTDKLATWAVALGTWAWGDSGEIGNGYFGSSLTQAGLEEIADKAQAAGFSTQSSRRKPPEPGLIR
jgi:hypothetical protein